MAWRQKKHGQYSVHKSLGLLQAISLQDTSVKFGNIEKRVGNLSEEKSAQDMSAGVVCWLQRVSRQVWVGSGPLLWQGRWQCLSAGGVRSSVKHLILRNNIYPWGGDLGSSVASPVPVTCVTYQTSLSLSLGPPGDFSRQKNAEFYPGYWGLKPFT